MSERGRSGRTRVIPYCTEIPGGACPSVWKWPVRSLVTGTCPRCGKYSRFAWRVLKAKRMVGAR